MFGWLETSQLSALIRGEPWAWPLVLTLHSLGTALTIGLVFIVTLKMLGLFRKLPYAALGRFFSPIWGALALQAVTGFLLWVTKPGEYTADGAFELKIIFLAVGAYLIWSLHGMIAGEAPAWDKAGKASSRAVQCAAAALAVWSGALIAGRLTAQLGSLVAG